MTRAETRSWTVRDATPADRDGSVELVARAFDGSPFAADAHSIWQWLFLDHPAGPAKLVVADAGDRLAGQYATVPVRLHHAGTVVPAIMSVQTATDPTFQRQGVLMTLANHLYDQTREEIPVVFGFPNPAVAPTRYGRLGWVELRPFPLLGRPLAGMPAPRRRGRSPISSIQSFSAWADELWQTLAPELGTCTVRDAAYLNWRFCDAPYEYRRFALDENGTPVAFAVLGFAAWRGRKVAYLMELFVPPGNAAAARSLVAHCAHVAAQERARALVTIATRRHPHRAALLRSGFVPMPAALRRSFSFGVRQNGAGVVPNELFHIDDWYLSPADLDYV